jgi:hypothetical protein
MARAARATRTVEIMRFRALMLGNQNLRQQCGSIAAFHGPSCYAQSNTMAKLPETDSVSTECSLLKGHNRSADLNTTVCSKSPDSRPTGFENDPWHVSTFFDAGPSEKPKLGSSWICEEEENHCD